LVSARQFLPPSSTALDDCDRDSEPYLRELGVAIVDARQRIQFHVNRRAPVHRWSPYVQGFSAEFVGAVLERHAADYAFDQRDALVYDPFAGSGTVLVEAKLHGARAGAGTELNPFLAFLARTKLNAWGVDPRALTEAAASLDRGARYPAPDWLDSERQFAPAVLENLRRLRGGIEHAPRAVRDLLKVALAAILIECSNLRRTPCLSYVPKDVPPDAPWTLFSEKVREIAADLALRQAGAGSRAGRFEVITANAMDYAPAHIGLAITSPPYMNGLDYVINYKIELAWLGFADGQKQAKALKDQMVVCDNVSHAVTAAFEGRSDRFADPWLTDLTDRIRHNIDHWGEGLADRMIRRGSQAVRTGAAVGRATRAYRRRDMPLIVAKYFDDMARVMARVAAGLNPGGRFVLVVGDSLIAGVYVPTDLLLAKIGRRLGLDIERIEKARSRRSGQFRAYRLRETVITLKKPG
jgi:hypothetical protein